MISFLLGVCVFQAFLLRRDSDVSNWTKAEVQLEAKGTNPNSRLQLTTSRKGVIWFDQVSAMPLDTYKVFVIVQHLSPKRTNFLHAVWKVQALSNVEDNICIEDEHEQDLGFKL